MPKHKYPVGYKFNKLTILGYLGQMGNSSRHSYYMCQCECGKVISVVNKINREYDVIVPLPDEILTVNDKSNEPKTL